MQNLNIFEAVCVLGYKPRYGTNGRTPIVRGVCNVRTICGGVCLNEPPMNERQAIAFTNDVLSHYQTNGLRTIVRRNIYDKRRTIYERATVVDTFTNDIVLSIEIYN